MNRLATILIVDDIAANRQTLVELLDTPDYQLVEAPDGPTALRMAAENPPDLVLLDVMMPCMDGFEVCRQMRATPSLAEVPIIMVTALDDPASVLAGLGAGADDFLAKPVNRAILRARVRTITRLNRYRRLVDTRLALETEAAEHQLAEESLRLLGAAMEQANDSIMITDAELTAPGPRILCVNAAFTKMTGYTPAEVLGKTPRILQGPDSDRAVLRELREKLGREEIFRGETINYRKNGEAFDLEWQVSPIRDASGAVTHYAAVQRDITPRKQTERALRQSEEEYRGLFNSIEEGFCVIELMFDQRNQPVNYRFLQVNPSFETQSGLIAAAGKTLLDHIPNLEAHWLERMGQVALTGKSIRFISEVKELDRWFEVHAFRLGQTQSQKVAVLFNDITERKQAEADARNVNTQLERKVVERTAQLEVARAAAEKANLAKSEFLSSMSHELRSPLNAILGFAQLLESATPPPTASQKPRIAQILQAGWYLLKLINEILDLASIESGKVSMSPEPVSLSELLSVCRDMMEPQAQLRGIQITFPHLDNTIFVHADRTRLQQIVVNLLSNAIKYNQEQGTVMVDCAVTAPGRVRLSFKDTGPGLSPEKLAQLFQPFNRLGQETGSVPGTGIGLVVTKRLLEKMNGAIGVESLVGAGSIFWCELDAIAAPQVKLKIAQSAAGSPRPAPTDGPRRTLLYIEDNPANLALVEQIIAEYPNLRLLTAVTGTLGLEVARSTMPEVILMDINLPGISGLKALQILRDDPATAPIPVVALSANAMPQDIAKGLEAGFFRYLTKPIRVQEFMDTLNEALEFTEKTRGTTQKGESTT